MWVLMEGQLGCWQWVQPCWDVEGAGFPSVLLGTTWEGVCSTLGHLLVSLLEGSSHLTSC